MIQFIGVEKDLKVEIREKLSIISSHMEINLKKLGQICDEVVILSTCNRTEIYYKSEDCSEEFIEEIFKLLKWDKSLIKYIFHYKGEGVAKHLMEVACGFDSSIVGEDQILSQIKAAYEASKESKIIKEYFQRLFQMAIACGKEFRTVSALNKIHVSSSSIVVNAARKRGIKNYMLLGYGDVGKLTARYILNGDVQNLYIAVRNTTKDKILDSRMKFIPFSSRNKYYEAVDCIISCTSAPHIVIKRGDLPANKLLIFDLAVPRDVEQEVGSLENVELYDIDAVSKIDEKNRKKRREVMEANRNIVEKYIEDYNNWNSIQKVSGEIKKLKKCGEEIYLKRYATYKHKKATKNNEELAEVLLKSTSDAFINRAIEVLKEEQMKGRGAECLRLIEKIFYKAK